MGFMSKMGVFTFKMINGVGVPYTKKSLKKHGYLKPKPAFPEFGKQQAKENKKIEQQVVKKLSETYNPFVITNDERKVLEAFTTKGYVIKKENYLAWLERQEQQQETQEQQQKL